MMPYKGSLLWFEGQVGMVLKYDVCDNVETWWVQVLLMGDRCRKTEWYLEDDRVDEQWRVLQR